MSDFRFWRHFPLDLRVPYVFLLIVTLFTIGWSVFEYLAGPERAVAWQTQPDFFSVPVVIDQFNRLVHTFDVKTSGYVITEQFAAGQPALSTTVAYIYLSLVALAVVYFLTAITTLKRIPYAVGMLLFMLFAASLNTDALGIIQSTRNYFLIIIIAAFGLLTYYFQAFATHIKFTFRLLFLLVLAVTVIAVIYLRSGYDFYTTSLHLIGHSSPAMLIGGVLFVLLVSFDNIQAMLWLNGQGTTPGQRAGAGRFILVTLLYLCSLVFIFLAQTGFFQVDVSVITPFFLLVASFFTGLWGFRQRETMLHRVVPFASAGAFIYLSLAIIAFLGASYAFGTANDPIVETFNDAVLFTHIAFGALFFIYVLVNFGPAIHKRLPVYRVVYNPQRVPFFTVYAAGAILLAILVMRTNLISFNQARSGYYNYLGDLYLTLGNDMLAERYYHEGHVYENNNVRSNMNLAAIAAQKHYSRSEIFFLQRTLKKRPQEKMYAKLAAKYAGQGNLFEAMFTIREGLKKFPDSYRLHSNMALLFGRTDMTDSAAFYLNRAHNLSSDPVLKTNSLALQIRNGLLKDAAAYAAKNKTDYPAFQSNVALLELLTPDPARPKNVPAPAEIIQNEGSFMRYYHHLLANLPKADATDLKQINDMLRHEENAYYFENLNLLKALVLRYHSDRTLARKTLEQLTLQANSNDGYYYNLLGLWLLEENIPQAAADYFNKAKEARYSPAFLNHAYALALAGQTAEAENEAIRAMSSGDPAIIKEAMALQQTVTTFPNALGTSTNDTLRARLLQIYQLQLPTEVKLGVAGELTNPILKANALATIAEELIQDQKTEQAQGILDQLQDLKTSLPEGKFNRLEAALLLAQNQCDQLPSFLEKHSFGFGYETLKNYYRATCLRRQGKAKQAKPLFDLLPNQLPYHAGAITETIKFYGEQQEKPMKAYDLLLSALAYNPYSPELLKAYILKAVEMNLTEYAAGSLEKLRELVPADEYATFNARYEQAVAEKEATADQW